MTTPDAPISSIRLDKWLWYARFFKSRSLAAAAVKGPIRLNGQPGAKPSHSVRAGDVVTFAQGDRVRVIEILAPGTRRGPATEAQTLYRDLQPERPEIEPGTPEMRKGGRPTGKARRDFDAARARIDDSAT
ncbi:RNA-binding S4 domain-containing protein [Pararhodobacter sp.]|uniref:RNA-binding S4 domain-containing protein n=1 Tax=Pararhodobacter sp. TaxID=2127056 RepID=UPI002AFDEE8A|nr:RNA-binding S4 domain-containing protein [Pararhodobacter sp.]